MHTESSQRIADQRLSATTSAPWYCLSVPDQNQRAHATQHRLGASQALRSLTQTIPLCSRERKFRAAACYVAEAFARVPTVRRVVLFGSVASPPRPESGRRRRDRLHEPKDVDLAVWLDGVVDLDSLRKLSAQALNRLWHDNQAGVAHHQVDIFFFDATGNYLGRLCHFNQCPKHKPQCRADGCGTVPFLQQHDGFVFDSRESLHPGRIQILYDRHVAKGAVPDKIQF
jgi:predicted nucleotidyltransferase